MRTVSCSCRLGVGGGALPGGMSAWGMSARRCVSPRHTATPKPQTLWTEWQTDYVAEGKNARQALSLFYSVFQEEIRNNVKPVMYVRMRLGEFDPPEMNPYLNITDMSLINCEAHRQVALDAAMKSFVLLKNNHDTLPLKKLPVDQVAVSSMFKIGIQDSLERAPTYYLV